MTSDRGRARPPRRSHPAPERALGAQPGSELARPATIEVTVRLFAELREIAGVDHARLRLPAGSPVEAVWEALARGAEPGSTHVAPAFAVNHAWARREAELHDGDMVAVLLPGSGG